jgi:hypothetical protein
VQIAQEGKTYLFLFFVAFFFATFFFFFAGTQHLLLDEDGTLGTCAGLLVTRRTASSISFVYLSEAGVAPACFHINNIFHETICQQ